MCYVDHYELLVRTVRYCILMLARVLDKGIPLCQTTNGNTLPLADTDKIASILNTLNCDYTLQTLHNMQRPTVMYILAITKLVRKT